MLVPSRRTLISGLGALIAAPALVRVDSLMPIRGVLLDPWVIAFDLDLYAQRRMFRSQYDPLYDRLRGKIDYFPGHNKNTVMGDRIKFLNNRGSGGLKYHLVRESELSDRQLIVT